MCFSSRPSALVTVCAKRLSLLIGMCLLGRSLLDLTLSSPEHEARGDQGSLRDTDKGQALMPQR